jgi:outer membrane protein OmpA-like peptidoglycan-associated protein
MAAKRKRKHKAKIQDRHGTRRDDFPLRSGPGIGQTASNAAFNAEEQLRAASQKATAALAALQPGFSAKDLVSGLNLDVINFASGSAVIPADSSDYLNRVAIAMKAAPVGTVLEIAGHTDNSGDSASNLALSQQRADSVRNYLVQQGVAPGMLVAKGYGDTRPVASNDTHEGKFRNRRIEFTVQYRSPTSLTTGLNSSHSYGSLFLCWRF